MNMNPKTTIDSKLSNELNEALLLDKQHNKTVRQMMADLGNAVANLDFESAFIDELDKFQVVVFEDPVPWRKLPQRFSGLTPRFNPYDPYGSCDFIHGIFHDGNKMYVITDKAKNTLNDENNTILNMHVDIDEADVYAWEHVLSEEHNLANDKKTFIVELFSEVTYVIEQTQK